MAYEPRSPLQVQCTCRCRDEKPAFYPEAESWNKALEQHKGNFMSLVTDHFPLAGAIRNLLGVAPPRFNQMGYRISLAEMHRMHMRALQIELVKIAVALQFDIKDENGSAEKEARLRTARQDALEKLEPAMEKYTQAIRDYEYMMTSSRAYDYFIVSYERHHDKVVIRDAMQEHFEGMKNLYDKEKNYANPTGPWEYPDKNRAQPIGGTRRESLKSLSRHAFWWRLSAATIGAGFLLGPMWLLALKQRLYLQLEATTGFVLGFGLTLAFFVERIDQVFAGTLAYAAVLMVFVGLSVQEATGAPNS